MARVLFALLLTVSLTPTTGPSIPAQIEDVRVPAPLVIDVSGDGFQLTDVARGVNFDLDGDGVVERVAWTAPGSDDSFVALDENHNGRVDGGYELIGAAHSGPSNGFAALAAYAAYNRAAKSVPGVLTSADDVFNRIVLWCDKNHNGVSEEDELESLAHAGFTKIYLGIVGVLSYEGFGNFLDSQTQAMKVSQGGVEVGRPVAAFRFARR